MNNPSSSCQKDRVVAKKIIFRQKAVSKTFFFGEVICSYFRPKVVSKTFFFWRSNMFLFSTKSSLKELFFLHSSTDVFHMLFHWCLLLTSYSKAIIAIIRTSCTCVGQSLQSSELVTLALGNHCNHQSLLHLRWVIIAITSTCNTYEKQSSQSLVLVLLARRKYRKIWCTSHLQKTRSKNHY